MKAVSRGKGPILPPPLKMHGCCTTSYCNLYWMADRVSLQQQTTPMVWRNPAQGGYTVTMTKESWGRKTNWMEATQQGVQTQNVRTFTPSTKGIKSTQVIRPPQSMVFDSSQARWHPHQKVQQHLWVNQCQPMMGMRRSIHQKAHQHLWVNPCQSI
jgi:hypothetical protein